MWKRAVNERFSGGDKKRNEIFQLVVLQPRLAILDETDSGLDVDALRIVADGVNSLRSDERAFVVVIHYQRLLNYITVDWIVGQSSSLALFRTSMLNTNAMPDASCTGSPGPADKPEVRRDGYGTMFAIDM